VRRRLIALSALVLVSAIQPDGALDPEQLYREGVAARHGGENERSIGLLRRVVAAQPDNADAHLQLGLAFMARVGWTRRTPRCAGPRARARLCGRARRAAAARRAPRRTREAAETRWRLDVDGSYSALEGSAPARLGGGLGPAPARGERADGDRRRR
jgi:hypothetical protein